MFRILWPGMEGLVAAPIMIWCKDACVQAPHCCVPLQSRLKCGNCNGNQHLSDNAQSTHQHASTMFDAWPAASHALLRNSKA